MNKKIYMCMYMCEFICVCVCIYTRACIHTYTEIDICVIHSQEHPYYYKFPLKLFLMFFFINTLCLLNHVEKDNKSERGSCLVLVTFSYYVKSAGHK